MIITKETKERFVKMLDERQIIVIHARYIHRRYPQYKVIGANSEGKWDFTPCIVELSNCEYIPVLGGQIAICGALDVVGILQEAVRKLWDERIESKFYKTHEDACYALYSYCRDQICTFFV